jgi:hypothetical protein
LLCSAAKKFGIASKPCILFSRAAKKFGVANKSTVFCSAVQRKIWNLPTTQLKSTVFCSAAPRSEIFGIATESTVFCSGAQRNFLGLRTRALYFIRPRTEKVWNSPTKTTQVACFCSAAQRKTLELRTKVLFCSATQRKIWSLLTAAQINFFLFCRAVKNFGIYQRKQLKSTVVSSRSAAQPKNLEFVLAVFCSAAQKLLCSESFGNLFGAKKTCFENAEEKKKCLLKILRSTFLFFSKFQNIPLPQI